MKKLMLLITIVMINFSCFSQTDTTKILVPKPIIKEVVKELIEKDACEAENAILYTQINLYKEKEVDHDSIKKVYIKIIENDDKKFIESQSQFINSQEINTGLKKDLSKQKTKTGFYQVTTVILTALSIFIAVK